jgi:prepilin signal peptidase PulO-like enzyme (type II secretory pathway)
LTFSTICLPNVITVPGIVIGFALSLVLPPGWKASLIGLIAGGGLLFAIAEAWYRFRGIEGLGMGDVKMLAMIGAFLGWKLMLVTLGAVVVRWIPDRRRRHSAGPWRHEVDAPIRAPSSPSGP